MVLKPSRWTFENMLSKLSDPAYHNPREGDQAFLQLYWRFRNFGLPMRYNLNIVMFEHHRKSWDHLWMVASVVHYTIRKPKGEWGKQCRKDKCSEWMPLNVCLLYSRCVFFIASVVIWS
jgi:hypothetical protein